MLPEDRTGSDDGGSMTDQPTAPGQPEDGQPDGHVENSQAESVQAEIGQQFAAFAVFDEAVGDAQAADVMSI